MTFVPAVPPDTDGPPGEATTPHRRRRPLPALTPAAWCGFGLVGLVLVLAAFVPVLAPDPNAQALGDRLMPPAWSTGGSWSHALGTDELGRDVLARTASGAQISLLVAFVAVGISGGIGVAVGLLAGYRGGRADRVVARVIDIQLAFPFILLVVLMVGALGAGLGNLILVLGATGWVVYARVVRAQAAAIRGTDFVRAAETVGVRPIRIAVSHVLPNCLSSVVVIASLAVAQMVLWETALSFLGLGVRPPAVSWGMMLSASRQYMTVAPHLTIVPGVAIVMTVLGTSLLGEWLRDVLDPRFTDVHA